MSFSTPEMYIIDGDLEGALGERSSNAGDVRQGLSRPTGGFVISMKVAALGDS